MTEEEPDREGPDAPVSEEPVPEAAPDDAEETEPLPEETTEEEALTDPEEAQTPVPEPEPAAEPENSEAQNAPGPEETDGEEEEAYPWEGLSDEELLLWLTDPAHEGYIIALLVAGGREYSLFTQRIDSIADPDARLEAYAYIGSLAENDAAENDGTPPAETEDETLPEQTEQSAEHGESPEETDTPPEGLFPGPQPGFTLSEKQKAVKASLKAAGTAERILSLTEGRDYEAGILIFNCDDRAYAQTVAEVYGAELLDISYGIATIVLGSGTVAEAVALAADTENNYPPVEPDWLFELFEGDDPARGEAAENALPVSENWDTWVNGPDAILNDPDTYLKDPTSYSYQWQHDTVNTYEAWSVTTGDPSVLVAVIDSGVNASHPDLHDISVLGISTLSKDIATTPYGSHATHVAGIIAATLNNGIGGAGIAPGVSILSIRVVSSSGGISNKNLSIGIGKAVEAGADIINISIGGVDYSTVLEEALTEAYNAGVTVIASAGNNGDNGAVYPAAVSTVIAVSSVNRTGYRSGSSSYGSWVDLSAPGEDIMSTVNSTVNPYNLMSGTSMACPMVSGVAALYMSRMGHVSPDKMKQVLRASVSPCRSSGMGTGIIDASRLFTADRTAPVFTLDDTAVTGSVKAKASSILSFTGQNSDGAIIYTANGSDPSIANGAVKNGIVSDTGSICVGDLGPVGTTWTVKAAFVNKIGVRSDIATLKVTVTASDEVSELHIIAPDNFDGGKSVKLSVGVEPKYGSTAVSWSLTKGEGVTKATISQSGVLRTAETDSGEVTVCATSLVDPTKSATATIRIKNVDLVASMGLTRIARLVFSETAQTQRQLNVSFRTRHRVVKKQAPTGSNAGVQAVWTSSDKNVVLVDEFGMLTAVGVGKAKVTCYAMDGSGISKSCSVEVRRGADSIAVTGQAAVPKGTSALYKAVFTPTNASNKAVTWSLEDAPDGVKISSKGKLSVPAGTPETEFYVCAAAKDGTGIVSKLAVTVIPRVTSLRLQMPPEGQGVRYTAYQGTLKTITLYTVSRPYENRTENTVDLDYTCVGPEQTLMWRSSNPAVASVDEYGVVTAHKKGTATISIRANDGSGMKASVKVNVIVPASSLTIVPSHKIIGSVYYLGVGCKVSNKAVVGTGFGTPGSSRTKWTIELILADGEDVTESWRAKKWVTLTSSGTLKVNSAAAAAVKACDEVEVFVRAFREEEELEDEVSFMIVPKVTSLTVSKSSVHLAVQTGNGKYAQETVFITPKSFARSVTVTSSDPSIAGASAVTDYSVGRYVKIFANNKTGTATITVRANDGSGKTAKIKVYVTKE